VWRDNKLRDRQPFFPAIFFWLRAICDDEDGCVAVAVQQRVGGCRCCACNRRASICDRHRVLGVGRVENGRQMQVVGAHQERVQEAEERSSGCNAARGDTGAPSLPQCYEPQRTPFSVHSPHVRRCRGELAALHCRLLPHQRASTPLSHAPHTTRLPTNCIPKTELKCRRQSIHRGTCSRRPPRHATPRHATPRTNDVHIKPLQPWRCGKPHFRRARRTSPTRYAETAVLLFADSRRCNTQQDAQLAACI
jgi:hypothetical protein